MKNIYDITNAQNSIWLIEQFYKNSSINNVCLSTIINEKIDFRKLTDAINIFSKLNDASRIKLTLDKKNNIKQYFEVPKHFDIEIYNISNKDALKKLEDSFVREPFNLFDELLFRFKFFRFPNGTGGFIVNAHHIIADGFSGKFVVDSIIDIYHKLLNDIEIDITSFNSFIDVIESENQYLSSNRFQKDKKFWEETFLSIPEIATIPSIFSASNNPIAARKSFRIDDETMKLILDFCEKNSVSLFNFIMSIFAIYIGRISLLDEFVIGTPVLNRGSFKEKNTMGMFINILPVKFNLVNTDFLTFVKNNSLNILHCFKHSKYPYHKILDYSHSKNNSLSNLYDILISYQNAKMDNLKADYQSNWIFNGNTSNSLEIHISDMNNIGNLTIMYDYRIEKYTQVEIENMHQRICFMIRQIVTNPNLKINELPIVTPKESTDILEINKTTFDYDKNKTFIDYFKEQVKRNPSKTALIFENKKLSFLELDNLSDKVASHLISIGVEKNTFVGIMMNRCLEMIIGILGILKSGSCYLPIDPTYPKGRIDYILRDSNTKIILGKKTKNQKYDCIDISLNNDLYKNNCNIIKVDYMPDDLIYLIYTSGSTGNPKGVKVKNSNITNFIESTNRIFNFSGKTIVSLTTICFDIFGLELFCSLSNGSTLVLANEEEQLNQNKFNSLCLRNGVNIIQTTPSRVHALIKDPNYCDYLKNITDLLIGGENFPINLLQDLRKKCNSKIYNMYGPTETTIWSTFKDLTNEDYISIGSPIGNTSCFVLDKNFNLLPYNTPGYLYISGDGVSAGYLDSTENDNFINHNGTKLYNTNDLVYLDYSNNINYLYRDDNQIKLNGYRIDLSEIENKMLLIDSITDASVVYNKTLICYYVSPEPFSVDELIEHLLNYLPNYMLPSHFFNLERLPLTPSGKVNKLELSKLNVNNDEIELASTHTEKILSKIISTVLNKKNLDINLPFSTIGLDSLGIIEVQTRLIQNNIVLNTQDFYKYPSIKQLAGKIDLKSSSINTNLKDIPDEFKHKKIKHDNFDLSQNILGDVFLTGANGFLGVHVLNELLTSLRNTSIYCLVRGETYDASVEKLRTSFKFYFNKDISHYINKRVFILNGSISEDNLGLSPSDYNLVSEKVSTIIHTAANVKHYGDSKIFEKTNIFGTNQIANFAYKFSKRLIHISSISISGNYLLKENKRNVDFSENNLYIGQQFSDNVYVNSKLSAENIILDYMKKGLTAEILRIGILSGRYSDGVFQKNISENAFYNRLKTLCVLSKVPENILNQHIEFTPVDFCAKAIVLLSKNSIANNKVFHLYNQNLYKIEDFIHILGSFNVNIETISKEEFNSYIRSNPGKLNSIINDLTIDDNNLFDLDYSSTVNIKSDYTQEILKLLEFKWPILTTSYIKKIIEKGGFICFQN
ncbi:MAG: amino acid adenylation domain-containing protein [Clostridia bacterium]|nr:amino acid adenylation domain-containing protein [Clostridia bacterium]